MLQNPVHLFDLREEALPHLQAARRNQHAAIRVHVHAGGHRRRRAVEPTSSDWDSHIKPEIMTAIRLHAHAGRHRRPRAVEPASSGWGGCTEAVSDGLLSGYMHLLAAIAGGEQSNLHQQAGLARCQEAAWEHRHAAAWLHISIWGPLPAASSTPAQKRVDIFRLKDAVGPLLNATGALASGHKCVLAATATAGGSFAYF